MTYFSASDGCGIFEAPPSRRVFIADRSPSRRKAMQHGEIISTLRKSSIQPAYTSSLRFRSWSLNRPNCWVTSVPIPASVAPEKKESLLERPTAAVARS